MAGLLAEGGSSRAATRYVVLESFARGFSGITPVSRAQGWSCGRGGFSRAVGIRK